ERIPIRQIFPVCCASEARGASVRPSVRTTASPISRMGTSMAGGSLADEGCSKGLAAWVAHALLDYVVRPLQQRLRNRQPERLGGLQIDDQLELGGLLNRKIGGLSALQDLVHVDGSKPPHVLEVRPI